MRESNPNQHQSTESVEFFKSAHRSPNSPKIGFQNAAAAGDVL
jgi:hypothetical protein